MSTRPKQRGVALITALLVVALASIAAVAMLSAQNVAIHRTGNILASQQAWWYATGMEQWAVTLLDRDHQDGTVDSLDEQWARQVDFLPIENGYLKGHMVDLQGRFNLNSLAAPKPEAAMQQFMRLLENIPDVDPVQAPALAQAVRDWIDADINPQIPDGAEDNYYLGLEPAYRTPNRLMDTPSELLAVRGFTPAIYRALAPYVATLPQAGSAINVNTAPAPVLMSLAPDLDPAQIASLVDARKDKPYASVQSFLAEPAFAGRSIKDNGLSVSSQYFLARGEVHVGDGRVILYSLLYRDNRGNTRVIEHSKGAF